MRFPEGGGKIDMEKTEEMLMYAINNGVNYFDTAWIYHGGKSESIIGEIFEKNNCRKDVFIATKMPIFRVKSGADFDKFFDEQLKKLRTDYVDYYLLHCILSFSQWQRLKSFGVLEWIEKKKQEGKIRQIGFSYHGNAEDFVKVVDDFDWEFVMVQYNFLDVNFQAGYSGMRHAHGKGIPVVVMEPLKGGYITNQMPPDATKIFSDFNPERTVADWGFRYVFDKEETLLALSGMGNLEQIKQNIETASHADHNNLTDEEKEVFEKVKLAAARAMSVPCTACAYCLPCPQNINIPEIFGVFNKKQAKLSKYFQTKINYLQASGSLTSKTGLASQCNSCGKCVKICPQQIDIPLELKKCAKSLETPVFKIIKFGSKFVIKKD
jgi:hypothetical protein